MFQSGNQKPSNDRSAPMEAQNRRPPHCTRAVGAKCPVAVHKVSRDKMGPMPMPPQEAEILYRQSNPRSPEELAAGKEAARKARAEAKEREKRIRTCIESGCNNQTPPRQNYHTMSMEFSMTVDPYHHRCRPCYAKWLCRNAHLETEHAGARRERNCQIVRQTTSGVSRADVDKAFGTIKAYVSRIYARAGVRAKDLCRQERSARNAEIVERVQAGETFIALAQEFWLAWKTVQRICQRAGRSVADRSPDAGSTAPAYLQKCIQEGADRRPRGKEVLRRELHLQQGRFCGICGQVMALEGTHIDHIVPRTRGRTDDRANLQLTHAVCNIIKKDSIPYVRGVGAEGEDG